jgi:hypothetical protein
MFCFAENRCDTQCLGKGKIVVRTFSYCCLLPKYTQIIPLLAISCLPEQPLIHEHEDFLCYPIIFYDEVHSLSSAQLSVFSLHPFLR